MKVVICDDNIQDLAGIKNLLIKYREYSPKVDFEVEKFSDAVRLSDKIQKNELADIYVLDMIMTEKTGIDIGNQIRRTGSGSAIIYITSSDEFALDAYDVHAVRYLLKPVSEERFFEAMDYAVSCTRLKTEPMYLVRTKDGLISLSHSRIEYIEQSARRLEIYLTSGECIQSIFIRRSFDSEIEELLNVKGFIRVHKSFLVNLKYIKQLISGSAVMESGRSVPVSRAKAAEVKREYMQYVSEYYR